MQLTDRIATEHRPPALQEEPGIDGGRLIFLILVMFAAFLIWREFEPLMFFRPVEARVLSSGVTRVEYFTSRGASRLTVPDVDYRYRANGTTYLGMQFRRTELIGWPDSPWRLAAAYPVGARVTAWYNPLNPKDAVLWRKPHLMLFVMMLLLTPVALRIRNVGTPRGAVRG